MSDLEVVIIETKNGPVRINKIDFNPKIHKIYSENKSSNEITEAAEKEANEAKVALKVAELTTKGVKLSIQKIGKGKNAKFFIADETGENITDVTFDDEVTAIGFAFPQPK